MFRPTCNCPYAVKNSGEVCKHVVWVLLNMFQFQSTNSIIFQKGYTWDELNQLKGMFLGTIPAHLQYAEGTTQNLDPTNRGFNAIFEKQIWSIAHFRKQKGRAPSCKTCKKRIQVDQLHVVVDGLFIPDGQQFATSAKFRFCPQRECLQKKPKRTNLIDCKEIVLGAGEILNDEELAICLDTGYCSI